MNGVLNVFKERGMTSRNVVDRVRRIYGIKKVGHGGTLDPEVAGVLPVLINRATKIADYLHLENKEYITELTLGEKRDTDDFTGHLLSKDEVPILNEKIVLGALNSFLGKSMQIPPIYSAKRVNGKRLYEYARKGQEVEIKPSEVEIFAIELMNFDLSGHKLLFKVKCSKGTYIRSLCRDIAEKLRTSGYMSYLIRTESAGLRIEDAVSLERLSHFIEEEREKILIPMDLALKNLKSIDLGKEKHFNLINGQHVKLDNKTDFKGLNLKVYAGDFIGIGQISEYKGEKYIKIIKRLEI